MNRLLFGLTIILFGTTLLCGLLWADARRDFIRLEGEIQQPWNAKYEASAMQAKANSENVSVSTIRKFAFPVTVELSDRVCVELRSRRGVTDGGEVYCFDKNTHKIVERFQPPT